MNQTTRPCRDPPGEQGNKRSSLKTPGVPGALGTRRNNVMVEFPLGLFQTGEETRSFQDPTPPQILLVIPSPSLSRHGEFGRRGEEMEKRECRSLGAPAESRTSSVLAALCGRRPVKRRRRGPHFLFLFRLLLSVAFSGGRQASFSPLPTCVRDAPFKRDARRDTCISLHGKRGALIADADA